MPADMAVALENVSIRYGQQAAVANLTLDIRRGEIFALLGPNGSGKSSTISAIAGLVNPFEGTIRVEGLSCRDQPAAVARLIGYVPQEIALYEELSAIDNLIFFASLYDIRGRERKAVIARVLEQVGLTARARDCVRTFSGGMQRRLNLAAALLHQPAVLLLDEPSVALDPLSRDTLFQILNDLREQGRAILLTTHQLEEAEQWCDRVGVLRQGRLVGLGRPAEVLHSRNSQKATLLGVLSEIMTERTESLLRRRLPAAVDLHVYGRQLRITAGNGEQLGMSMALLASEGIVLESFRSPPAQMEPVAINAPLRRFPDTSGLTGQEAAHVPTA